jgi:hypothetical protein
MPQAKYINAAKGSAEHAEHGCKHLCTLNRVGAIEERWHTAAASDAV